ncbi:site-specific integrase [Hymenobacter busanensis]|uniref:Site-specific integrase n=1 Tax=Hymenobacter busanensis TaxID=2607656 RepID=A0A7L4ZVS3_9BACT|nr:site-specific integrase [Hymenobacter busanensis]KAA9332083.1 site-specific integrase [Hymenobacter busanensis]QHJ07579.1 tyrosine-type recombinase/integrase [Hymenobacter busanensis]
MPSISFHLKRPQSDKPTSIFIWFNANGHRTKIYTDLKILPAKWDTEEQRAKTYRQGNAPYVLNDTLDLFREQLLEFYAEQRVKGLIPDATALRAAIEPKTIAAVHEEPDALNAFADWINYCSRSKRPNTIKVYRTALRHLREFALHAKHPMGFNDFTLAFADKFTTYLMQQRQLADSAIHKNLTTLKNFLGYAQDRGLHTNAAFKRFAWRRREPSILTLTTREVCAIADLVLPCGSYLDNSRALFLLGCYTGLRYSDISALRPEHIFETSLRITTQKTAEDQVIPLRPEARDIVARIRVGSLRPISNPKLNLYVKELAKLAGIDREVERVRYRGGQRLSERGPKYAYVTTHTARRTFVTLALEDGIEMSRVMKLSGHSTWAAFKRYVNVTDDSAAEAFAAVYGQ